MSSTLRRKLSPLSPHSPRPCRRFAQRRDLVIPDQSRATDQTLLEHLAEVVRREAVEAAASQLPQCVGEGLRLRRLGPLVDRRRVQPVDVLLSDDLDHVLGGEFTTRKNLVQDG